MALRRGALAGLPGRIRPGGESVGPETFTITCGATDALSGIDATDCETIQLDAASLAPGPNRFEFFASDQAGNTATTAITVTLHITVAGIADVIARYVLARRRLGRSLWRPAVQPSWSGEDIDVVRATLTERHPTGTISSMVRTLDLAQWAGRWVAIDEDDRVQRDAGSLKDLMAILDAEGVEGLSIMRAPAPGEPVVYGLG